MRPSKRPLLPRFLVFALALSPISTACTQTTVESLGGAGDDPLLDRDFGADAVTLGDVGVGADLIEFDLGDGECPVPADATAVVWTPTSGDFAFIDRETGSIWNVAGQAFAGPCAGVWLDQLPSFTSFWFSWSLTRHGGEVWNRDELNLPGEIRADESGECEVPCDEIRSGGPPPDGIPALDYAGRWNRPQAQAMLPADEITYLDDQALVLGVYIDGEARAYPHNLLWWHEIHVDRIGDRELNITYCPLTGSGMIIDAIQAGQPWYSFTSGRLFNANLTMLERDSDDPTQWNQMLLRGVRGPRAGETLDILPVTETTWGRWREMFPNTLAASNDTGYTRNYDQYPYGDYRTDHESTFLAVNPAPEDTFRGKDMVLVLEGASLSRAYAFVEMELFGDRIVINDEFEGNAVLVVYQAEHRMAVPYSRELNGSPLTMDGVTVP